MNIIKIAIAEDHVLLRKSIAMLFEKDSRFILEIEAENGQELIHNLIDKTIDVVILDINMPVLNGIETLQLIKEKYPEIKVVMFSSKSDLFTVEKVRRMGANSFVDKHSSEILIETVIQVHNMQYSYNAIFQPESKQNFN
ncbi:MAG: hypothetical protein COA32_10125 [Fluviicola sp.]|nr:MAG: hypothetical protein COA32_10125 [Fluviicola sp.]